MDSSFQTLDDFYVWKVSLKYLSQTYTALKYLQSPKTWYLKMSCYFDLCVQQKTQGFLKKAYIYKNRWNWFFSRKKPSRFLFPRRNAAKTTRVYRPDRSRKRPGLMGWLWEGWEDRKMNCCNKKWDVRIVLFHRKPTKTLRFWYICAPSLDTYFLYSMIWK